MFIWGGSLFIVHIVHMRENLFIERTSPLWPLQSSYILLCACCVFITADLFLIRGKKVGQDIQDVFPNQSFWFHFPYYCIVKTIDNVRQHGRENETKTWFVKTCGNLECDLWGPSKTKLFKRSKSGVTLPARLRNTSNSLS